MKAGKEHRVPICSEARGVLDSVRGLGHELVFPSPSRGPERQLSDTVFKALMERMGWEGLTVHGYRSTFRDWCGEYALADREVAEAALAHSFGSKVERAYARSDLYERRRQLMNAWGRYCTNTDNNVVQLDTKNA